MIILVENNHSFLIVEHDPLLYEEAGEMVEYLAQAFRQTSKESQLQFCGIGGGKIYHAQHLGAVTVMLKDSGKRIVLI